LSGVSYFRWHVHCPGDGTEGIATFEVAKFKSNRIFKNVSKSLAWVWSREQINETKASRKSVAAYPLLEQQLRRAIANGHAIAIADGITDISLGSLTTYARKKLASWQATYHPLVGPTYTEVQSLLE
jgi:Fe-S cluster biosynthesis and repair protein YggX